MTRKLLAPVCIGLLMAISSISFAQRTADEVKTMAVRVVESSANNDIPVLSNKGKQSRQRSSERLRHRDRALTKAPEPLDTKQYAALTGKSTPVPTPTLDVQAGETPRLLTHIRQPIWKHRQKSHGSLLKSLLNPFVFHLVHINAEWKGMNAKLWRAISHRIHDLIFVCQPLIVRIVILHDHVN